MSGRGGPSGRGRGWNTSVYKRVSCCAVFAADRHYSPFEMLSALSLAVSIALLAGSLIGGLATDLIPSAVTTGHHSCEFLHHNLTVTETRDDLTCTGIVSVLSCSGMCASEIIPHYFLSRSVLVLNRQHHFANIAFKWVTLAKQDLGMLA